MNRELESALALQLVDGDADLALAEMPALREITRQPLCEREAEREWQAQASEKALAMWNAATPAAIDHPYLVRNNVAPFDLREYAGSLLVPVRLLDGTVNSLQLIEPNGTKRFYPGTRTKGGMHLIGEWGEPVLIAEDYVTAARWFLAFGYCTLVAFDMGNMFHVGKAIRDAYPYTSLFFVAETQTDVEIADLTKAVEALEGTVLTKIDRVGGVSHE